LSLSCSKNKVNNKINVIKGNTQFKLKEIVKVAIIKAYLS